MKKILFTLLSCFVLLVGGCSSKNELKLTQLVQSIEVNSEYNALEFVQYKSGDDVKIVIENNGIDITRIGTYEVSYNVYVNDKATLSSITIEVVDTKIPEITILKEMEIQLGDTSWKIEDFASAKDEYDGDITKNIKIVGDYNINIVGEYSVVFSVSDSSNNEQTRDIVIKIIDSPTVVDDSIYGEYFVDYSSNDSYNPRLTLNSDNTFRYVTNRCEGMQTYDGTFTQVDDRIVITSDGENFGETPSDTTVTFKINSNGTLTYLDDYAMCSPFKDDIFKKK